MHTAILGVLLLMAGVALCASPTQKKCLVFGPMTLPNGKAIQGTRNVGGCTCKEAYKEEFDPRIADKAFPQCNDDGTWRPRQMQWRSAYCVDKNGNQITEKQIERPGELKCD
ncbi:uncharacterized protein LOC129600478 [Paramacrobiotus metropolitanus]|uniref:uncharacterized protein LOC129600282 n=1 Tax=Paramacrobiotus metropolitanus TaxID=2943436 RepID=UPI002445EA1C|nr:uncharacterized protein LOC129600282 [Paramacrobiotus metropolitanus]XP_055354985.1 uncharacterized protein LOC129600478 [Paramacrobiotus metropolitanus]